MKPEFASCDLVPRKDPDMNVRLRCFLLGLLALALLVGCQDSDDGVNGPSGLVEQETGLVYGDVGSGSVSFEFASVEGLRQGPFLVRGYNIAYDTELGALVVDVTVVNAGEETYPEPVTLSFVDLLPEGVTVLNADNGETGPGAAFLCEFENDDAMWTPGEESLPRTVQFGVTAGTSIGFVARIDVGLVPGGGAVGGVVWHDVDEDGAMDADEAGLPGVGLRLQGGDDLVFMTQTEDDGKICLRVILQPAARARLAGRFPPEAVRHPDTIDRGAPR